MKEVKKAFDINAHIVNINCEVGYDDDTSKALISFDNLGYGIITAIKFNAKGYNSFGDVVQVNGKEKFFLIIQDISIEKNCAAKDLKAKLPNGDIRKLELEECQICCADGSVLTYGGKDSREIVLEEYDISETDEESINAIEEKLRTQIKYYPKDVDWGWICTCGRLNKLDSSECSSCKNTKADVFSITDEIAVKSIIEEYRKNEEDRQEQAKQEAILKEKNAKKRNVKIGISIIIAIIFAIIIGNAVVMSGRSTFSSADEMRSAMQGTYTYYSDYGSASRQIVISGDKATYKWSYGNDMETTIDEWNYKRGTFSTFETLVVTNQGYIKDGNDVYKKGGTLATSSGASTPSTSSKFTTYVDENKVKLDNKDVQYDMANNVDKMFSLVGYAELDDYYNYGFDDDIESSYFCLAVTPTGGSYSDRWYIYCHRDSFEKLFTKAKENKKVYVQMVCQIPSYRYEKNQQCMASLEYVVY